MSTGIMKRYYELASVYARTNSDFDLNNLSIYMDQVGLKMKRPLWRYDVANKSTWLYSTAFTINPDFSYSKKLFNRQLLMDYHQLRRKKVPKEYEGGNDVSMSTSYE